MPRYKPLPALPLGPNPTTLSVDSREHRSQIIRHVLGEIQDATLDSRRDEWVVSIEEALDDLSASISRGDWLHGLKKERRRRRAKIDRHATVKAAQKMTRPPSTMSRRSSSVQGEGQGRPPCEAVFFPSTEKPQEDLSKSLEELRAMVSRASTSSSNPSRQHLLLSLAPPGSRAPVPAEDSGFDLIPGHVGCTFRPHVFHLPEAGNPDAENIVLYGLKEYSGPDEELGLVGGTFTFKGITSPIQHHHLAKVLGIAVYTHLSLVLEQHLLVSFAVALEYPIPKTASPTTPTAPGGWVPDVHRKDSLKGQNRTSLLPSSIFNFFSRKSLTARRNNSLTGSHPPPRSGSLDVRASASHPENALSRVADDTSLSIGTRIRRLSFMPADPRKITPPKEEPARPFAATIKRLEEARTLLSTSVGVKYPLPPLMVALAKEEEKVPGRKLRGDERTGLFSLLGWEGKDSQGRAMAGITGFVRHQSFPVLASLYIPAADSPQIPQGEDAISAATKENTTSFVPCDRPRWVTYRYYSHDERDMSLGEMLEDLVSDADELCVRQGCGLARGKHQQRYIHGGVQIAVDLEEPSEPQDGVEQTKDVEEKIEEEDADEVLRIQTWVRCSVCKAESPKKVVSEGAHLLSFAKYLELLVYSPRLCSITPVLCEHTTPPKQSSADGLPPSRFNMVRLFECRKRTVTFSLSTVEDIFDIRVPRLQIVRTGNSKSPKPVEAEESDVDEGDEDKRNLRREIKVFWECVSDHVDKLEDLLSTDDMKVMKKALPRLPSTDDAYDDIDEPSTPRASVPRSPISGLPGSVGSNRSGSTDYFGAAASDRGSMSSAASSRSSLASSTASTASAPPPTPSKETPPQELLLNMRHTFQRTEQSLYAQLARTPADTLNDVRRSFLSSALGADRRLQAWQKKHLPKAVKKDPSLAKMDAAAEPEWFKKSCHAAPDSNIIVREEDWGSIIAFTLSTKDYQRELSAMSLSRTPSSPPQTSLLSPPGASHGTSFFTSSSGYRFFTGGAKNTPDPDREDAVWHELEDYSAVISRKEHPRDPTSILSIREVLRQKSPTEGSSSPLSRFVSSGDTMRGNGAPGIMPPSAWARPAVEVTSVDAGGEVSNAKMPDSTRAMLHNLEASSDSRPGSTTTATAGTSNLTAQTWRARGLSSLSREADLSKENEDPANDAEPPEVPSKVPAPATPAKGLVDAPQMHSPVPQRGSFFTHSLSSGLAGAMRYMLNGSDGQQTTNSPYGRPHHGLLSTELLSIDERPHIKYDWTVGKRLKFSCTVYYAKQFDQLRRRCGVEDVFIHSLSRSANWAADGGKSKSNFWKTADDRFIIKTLVNAWNTADLQVLIDLGPNYFRYMDSTASRPTVLAKLAGFYTVEIRNLETGNVQAKADLLVMENLFYQHKVEKAFDLKGIQGRKVKAAQSQQTAKTLFDGEWIEGQQRTLTLLRPHSKAVLREAIRADAEFLAKSNIMDYSLLLGIDNEKKQIACGLVDTIGSYTFAKTLEYKAKQGLHSGTGKEITVMPPNEYQDRFVTAMENYFLACPDKWSKPLDDCEIISDVERLPSVL
ncbi:hypothetical protein EV714DRAFT_274120 [Schizophyllum commune]